MCKDASFESVTFLNIANKKVYSLTNHLGRGSRICSHICSGRARYGVRLWHGVLRPAPHKCWGRRRRLLVICLHSAAGVLQET